MKSATRSVQPEPLPAFNLYFEVKDKFETEPVFNKARQLHSAELSIALSSECSFHVACNKQHNLAWFVVNVAYVTEDAHFIRLVIHQKAWIQTALVDQGDISGLTGSGSFLCFWDQLTSASKFLNPLIQPEIWIDWAFSLGPLSSVARIFRMHGSQYTHSI
ncbi:hypothetical protein LENED_008719 [Lentinula edodes]|uniref:Uncharacterized protein n=1 Tax=Lentinula edodes TaxID=5353 RepID=A0A1Q3EHT0_LENED|nr:hypothetical protein LENED_008719 [Lentinula edodes]